MATTSFSESLKYGGQLFGFLLAIFLVGGIGLALGAVLAVPEIQNWLGSGSVQTAPIAGGLVLFALGMSVLVVGQFALVHKLIVDSVSKGNQEPATENTVTAADSETVAGEYDETVAGEHDGTTTGKHTGDDSAGPAGGEPDPGPVTDQPGSRDTPPAEAAETSRQPTAADERPAQQPHDGGVDDSSPATAGEQPVSREQTAEEIAFGSGATSDSETSDSPDRSAPEPNQQTPTADEFEYPADDGSTEFEDERTDLEDEGTEFEEEPTAKGKRGNTETAGNSSSDPLADTFDEE